MKQRCTSWAALIKKVYEVEPLYCSKCGGAMTIISFIEKCQPDVIVKIQWHCGPVPVSGIMERDRIVAAFRKKPGGRS